MGNETRQEATVDETAWQAFLLWTGRQDLDHFQRS